MSARAIISGALHKAAEERTSKAGNQFATFTIRENVNGSTRWWRVVAFNESVIEAIKELAVGSRSRFLARSIASFGRLKAAASRV